MRRVVVTGMGIVSSIGNSARRRSSPRCGRRKSGIVHSREVQVELGFRDLRSKARRQLDTEGSRRSSRHAVSRRRARLGPIWRWTRPSGTAGLAPDGDLEPPHRHPDGLRRPLRRKRSWRRPTSPAPRGQRSVGPFAVPKAMSSTASATLATWFKIKGVELLDFVRLRDVEPLHRQCLRDDRSGASRM